MCFWSSSRFSCYINTENIKTLSPQACESWPIRADWALKRQRSVQTEEELRCSNNTWKIIWFFKIFLDEPENEHNMRPLMSRFRSFKNIFTVLQPERTGYSGSHSALHPAPLTAFIIQPHLASQKTITLCFLFVGIQHNKSHHAWNLFREYIF